MLNGFMIILFSYHLRNSEGLFLNFHCFFAALRHKPDNEMTQLPSQVVLLNVSEKFSVQLQSQ